MAKTKLTQEPLTLSTHVVSVDPWNSPAEALEYLRGDFAGWCHVLTDFADAGAPIDTLLSEDLASIAEALADYLAHPRLMVCDLDPTDALEALTTPLDALHARLAEEGPLSFEPMGSTLPLVTRAILAAAEARATGTAS